jgi:hypothetical protein
MINLPNKRDGSNGAIAVLFHVVRLGPPRLSSIV